MATKNIIDMAFNAFIDDDSMATALPTNVCSGESIKAYADTKAAQGANADITSMTGLTGSLSAPTFILGTGGNEILGFTTIASAVNYIDVRGSATSISPSFTAMGDDAAVGMNFNVKNSIIGIVDITSTASPALRLTNAGNTGYFGFKAPEITTPDTDFVLPTADGSANFVLKTNGSATLSFTNGSQIAGTATNDNASAGNIGEYVSSTVLAGAAVALTSTNAGDITSISLTAGDWDVAGNIIFQPNAATTSTFFQGWISSTSATVPTAPNSGAEFFTQAAFSAGNAGGWPIGQIRISLSGTTTIYLSARSTFAVNTMSAYGFIGARRVR